MTDKKSFGIFNGFTPQFRSQQRVQTYKFEQGAVARVAFPDMKLASGISHWVPGLGYVFCFGDPDTVDQTRHDPNCPLCAANLDTALTDDAGKPLIGRATRRFAVNFIKYLTRGRGIEPLRPVQATSEVLKFAAGSFYNQLADLAGKGLDLQRTDFQVRCEEATYQNLLITDLGPAVYLSDKETAERILRQFAEDRLDDAELLGIIGREVSIEEVEAVLDRMRVSRGLGSTLSGVVSGKPVSDDESGGATAVTPKPFDLSSLFGD